MSSLPARLLLALALVLPAAAEVSTLRFFHLGEADGSAATPGSAATGSADSSGHPALDPLAVSGGALYSADVADGNSQLSMDFDGSTQYATTGNWDNPGTNFGMEVWVKPAEAGGEHVIAYCGDPGSNGWGILVHPVSGKFCALLGGKTFFGDGTIVPGQWTHLAFVCAGANSTSRKLAELPLRRHSRNGNAIPSYSPRVARRTSASLGSGDAPSCYLEEVASGVRRD